MQLPIRKSQVSNHNCIQSPDFSNIEGKKKSILKKNPTTGQGQQDLDRKLEQIACFDWRTIGAKGFVTTRADGLFFVSLFQKNWFSILIFNGLVAQCVILTQQASEPSLLSRPAVDQYHGIVKEIVSIITYSPQIRCEISSSSWFWFCRFLYWMHFKTIKSALELLFFEVEDARIFRLPVSNAERRKQNWDTPGPATMQEEDALNSSMLRTNL